MIFRSGTPPEKCLSPVGKGMCVHTSITSKLFVWLGFVYLWSTRGAKDVAVIFRVPLDSASLLKGLDLIQAKGCMVVSRVEAEGQLVDLAGVVLFDDAAQA